MKQKKYGFFTSLFLCILILAANAQQSFNKAYFFATMQSGDVTKIEAQLKTIAASSLKEKSAYSGALLMKKAALVNGAGNKLSLFKSGHKQLEASIKKNSSNAELRFLRLMIQEHAPGILAYKNDEQADADLIKKSFKDLPKAVQEAINSYTKQSKILKPADFNFEKE